MRSFLDLRVCNGFDFQNNKIHKEYELTHFNQNILNYTGRGSSGVVG